MRARGYRPPLQGRVCHFCKREIKNHHDGNWHHQIPDDIIDAVRGIGLWLIFDRMVPSHKCCHALFNQEHEQGLEPNAFFEKMTSIHINWGAGIYKNRHIDRSLIWVA